MPPRTHPTRAGVRRSVGAAGAGAAVLGVVLAGCGAAASSTAASPVTFTPAPYTPAPYTPAPYTLAPIPTLAVHPTPPTATEPGPSGPRPRTGQEFARTGRRGPGELVVKNGSSRDAYVTLARSGHAQVAVYVRAGSTARVRGIADGTSQVFFSIGTGWNDRLRAFTGDMAAQRFDETFPFRTTSRSSTVWTISLEAEPGGTASTSTVDPADVPR